MPSYQVELSDGRTFRVEADGPPSEADILAQLGHAPEPEEKSVSGLLSNAWEDVKGIGNTIKTAVTNPIGLIDAAKQSRNADVERQTRYLPGQRPPNAPMPLGITDIPVDALESAYEHPVNNALYFSPAAKPLAQAAGAAANVVGKTVAPVTGAAAKVAPALALDLAEFAFPRSARLLKKATSSRTARAIRQRAKTAPEAPAEAPESWSSLAGAPAGYDELAGLVTPTAKAVSTTAPQVAPAASTLESELMARETLAKPINWRTQDVTPMKRPGPGIHYGEESTPGLLKMLEDAQLAKNKALEAQILTAIRQRSHITGKTGAP